MLKLFAIICTNVHVQINTVTYMYAHINCFVNTKQQHFFFRSVEQALSGVIR